MSRCLRIGCFMAALFTVALSETNLRKYSPILCPLQLVCAAVILVDEGDSVARSGVEGAVNYVTRNQLATVTATTLLEVQEEEPSNTADQGDNNHPCIIIHTAPSVAGVDNHVVTITTPASNCPQCGRGG